ncbi:hypothetical protein B0H10DRAFT_2020446 [Mycena sp. CBHHK59/15]|nr:hypothetical protein B0H10DRAFT_2020446 [Mycena sp. CBHHK59/15]
MDDDERAPSAPSRNAEPLDAPSSIRRRSARHRLEAALSPTRSDNQMGSTPTGLSEGPGRSASRTSRCHGPSTSTNVSDTTSQNASGSSRRSENTNTPVASRTPRTPRRSGPATDTTFSRGANTARHSDIPLSPAAAARERTPQFLPHTHEPPRRAAGSSRSHRRNSSSQPWTRTTQRTRPRETTNLGPLYSEGSSDELPEPVFYAHVDGLAPHSRKKAKAKAEIKTRKFISPVKLARIAKEKEERKKLKSLDGQVFELSEDENGVLYTHTKVTEAIEILSTDDEQPSSLRPPQHRRKRRKIAHAVERIEVISTEDENEVGGPPTPPPFTDVEDMVESLKDRHVSSGVVGQDVDSGEPCMPVHETRELAREVDEPHDVEVGTAVEDVYAHPDERVATLPLLTEVADVGSANEPARLGECAGGLPADHDWHHDDMEQETDPDRIADARFFTEQFSLVAVQDTGVGGGAETSALPPVVGSPIASASAVYPTLRGPGVPSSPRRSSPPASVHQSPSFPAPDAANRPAVTPFQPPTSSPYFTPLTAGPMRSSRTTTSVPPSTLLSSPTTAATVRVPTSPPPSVPASNSAPQPSSRLLGPGVPSSPDQVTSSPPGRHSPRSASGPASDAGGPSTMRASTGPSSRVPSPHRRAPRRPRVTTYNSSAASVSARRLDLPPSGFPSQSMSDFVFVEWNGQLPSYSIYTRMVDRLVNARGVHDYAREGEGMESGAGGDVGMAGVDDVGNARREEDLTQSKGSKEEQVKGNTGDGEIEVDAVDNDTPQQAGEEHSATPSDILRLDEEPRPLPAAIPALPTSHAVETEKPSVSILSVSPDTFQYTPPLPSPTSDSTLGATPPRLHSTLASAPGVVVTFVNGSFLYKPVEIAEDDDDLSEAEFAYC